MWKGRKRKEVNEKLKRKRRDRSGDRNALMTLNHYSTLNLVVFLNALCFIFK